jgi:hypothetical protein
MPSNKIALTQDGKIFRKRFTAPLHVFCCSHGVNTWKSLPWRLHPARKDHQQSL